MTLQELIYACFDPIYEKDGGEIDVNCCFCTDKKRRLGINLQTGVAHCFKCEFKSGNRKNVIASHRGTFKRIAQAFDYDAEFSSDGLSEEVIVEKKDKKTYVASLPKEFEPLWRDINDSVGKAALRYCLARGISKRQLKQKRIGFCAIGPYAFRIVFPVWYRKRIRGFVCRDFTGKSDIKYLNSKGRKGLYNLRAIHLRKRKGIIVEGVFDVLSVERCKELLREYDVIGTLGSKLEKRQLKKLKTYNVLVIFTEPDRAGVEGAIKKAKALQSKNTTVKVVVPYSDIQTDTDPGGMSRLEIKNRIEDAVEFTPGIAALMRTRIAFNEGPIKKKRKYERKNSEVVRD